MFKNIFVTTDGSKLGNAAVTPAADLARKLGADLSVLYVTPNPSAYLGPSDALAYDPYELRVRLREEGAFILETARSLAGDVKVALLLREADGRDVAAAIAEEAVSGGADLIVMSTHGRTGVAHLLMGSVAERVLRRTKLPVLLTRGETPVKVEAPEALADAMPS